MYIYDDFDHTVARQRVAEFRDQVNRRLKGELSEEQFRPLRLMNGLCLHAAGRGALRHAFRCAAA